jgi:hypothetical protein
MSGLLQIDLTNAVIPRSEGWKHSITLCDWTLIDREPFAEAFNKKAKVSAPLRFHFGNHLFRIESSNQNWRNWVWDYPIVSDFAEEGSLVDSIIVRDKIVQPAVFENVNSSFIELSESIGPIEILSNKGEVKATFGKRFESLKKGYVLVADDFIVCGPRATATIQWKDKTGNIIHSMIREARMVHVNQILNGGNTDQFAEVRARTRTNESTDVGLTPLAMEKIKKVGFIVGDVPDRACCSVRG